MECGKDICSSGLLERNDMLTAEKVDKIEKTDKIAQCLQNRELSWLKFNKRVLEQAACEKVPLLERLKFISIFTTNLDEFYMVRVGSLTDSMQFSPEERENKTNMTAQQQLLEINKSVLPLYELRKRYFGSVTSLLNEYGIQHCRIDQLDDGSLKKLRQYFLQSVMPLLSPQVIDNRHPFPHIGNKQLHIAVSLKSKNKALYGIIAMPAQMDRIIVIEKSPLKYVLLEELILYFSDVVFELYSVTERTIIAVARNADIDTEAGFLDEEMDYRKHMSKIIRKRKLMAPVRLEIQQKVGDAFVSFLSGKINLQIPHVYESTIPLDLTYVFTLEKKLDRSLAKKLLWPAFTPYESVSNEKKVNIMQHVLKRDMLLSFPYESMSPFLSLIHQATEDPSVVSIKITLYRLARQSRLAEYLIMAAENGKEVVVLMELRARFDEINNIEWAQRLEEAGCRVIYGPALYKVHSKICLITRKEFGKISYITQFGTGNYNETTARLYTDLSLITANPEIGKDAAAFFNNLLLGNLDGQYSHLLVAPKMLKPALLALTDQEIQKAKSGNSCRIIIKCNSLTDKDIMEKLIEASQSGVKIMLIVRGICCLIPQVTGYTDNITIISIVGRFLEHSRIFCFGRGAEMKMYISSADMMTRNTERRVETACPVYDPRIKGEIFAMLEYMLADNTKAWEQCSNGEYQLRKPPLGLEINAQEMQMPPAWNYCAEQLPEESWQYGFKDFFNSIKELLKRRLNY